MVGKVADLIIKHDSVTKARAEVRKLNEELARTGQQASRGTQTATTNLRTMGTQANKVLGVVKSIAIGFGAGVGIAGATLIAKRAMDEYFATLDRSAKRFEDMADSAAVFVTVQEKGLGRAKLFQAVGIGAGAGIGPAQALLAIQSLQSLTGSFDKGIAAFRAVVALKRLGVDPESGREAIIKGIGAGETPQRTASLFAQAGKISAREPQFFAQQAPRIIGEFIGQKFALEKGLAVGVALSGAPGILPERVGVFGARGAGTLDDPKLETLFTKLGVKGGTIGEKLEALDKAGLRSKNALQRAGVKEERASAGLAALVQRRRTFGSVLAQLKGTEGAFAISERQRAEAAVPELTVARENVALGETIQSLRALGPSGKQGARIKRIEQFRALRAELRGIGFLAGEEGRIGQTKALGIDVLSALGGRLGGRLEGGPSLGGVGDPRREVFQRAELAKELKKADPESAQLVRTALSEAGITLDVNIKSDDSSSGPSGRP